ncbi:ectoine synthase [Lentzea xinjiangensis]|uniref:ectoine synthase n=1 Tax=Lentzea xinjiangensis TaxID=402600 RepID=UPI001C42F63A|nr:ectoine synthase [Lentzea xinjiangensis]
MRTVGELIGGDRDVAWGNGYSRRLLLAADGRGFSMTETLVAPGTSSILRYDNHFEACYCVEGRGEVIVYGVSYPISVGTMYAPERGETHLLRSIEGMRLICTFNPPLIGPERHVLTETEASTY